MSPTSRPLPRPPDDVVRALPGHRKDEGRSRAPAAPSGVDDARPTGTGAGGRHPHAGPVALLSACVAVAVASLSLPAALGYDPWAWLVWGREVGRLDLATTGGPSWKPLPVLIATPLSAAGGYAPALWMVTTRAVGLLALVGVGRLAARLAGPVAGVLAAALLLLTPDPEARYLRLVLEGHSAPLTVALAVWAVDRHLAGRRGPALVLGAALALDRPEAWPLLGLYGVWLWRREPTSRPLVVAVAVLVPLLWFGGDWWGSGDPWHGADTAQVDAQDSGRARTALSRAAAIVVVPAWLTAAAATIGAVRRRDRVVLGLAALVASWMTIVVALAVGLGYAAIGRFFLPAAAIVCVLAAVGAVRVVGAVPPSRARIGAVGFALVASSWFAAPRVSAVGPLSSALAERHHLDRQLDVALDRAGGPSSVGACGTVAIADTSTYRIALAWKLDRPLDEVDRPSRSTSGVTVVRAGGRLDEGLGDPVRTEVEELGRSVEWAIYAVDCPSAVDRSG